MLLGGPGVGGKKTSYWLGGLGLGIKKTTRCLEALV